MNWVEIGWLLIGFLIGVTVLRSLGPRAYRFVLKVRFWIRHGRKGRFILFVYSDSSTWKDYVETKILPRIEARSVVLNWSTRREWEAQMQFEMRLYDQWAGPGGFVPVAMIFPITAKARVYRLWQRSDNPKHGKDKVSKEAEKSFFEAMEQKDRSPAKSRDG
jgi:hypothetical protein